LNEYRLDRILFAGPRRNSEVVLARQTVKQRVLEAVEALPADATIEDAMERLFFLAKIQRGLEQADAGETLTHEEAKERLLK
jgi:predicted transcriptional regulator